MPAKEATYDFFVKMVFRIEVVVEEPVGNSGPGCDRNHAGAVEATVCELVFGGVENRGSSLPPVGIFGSCHRYEPSPVKRAAAFS